MSFIPTPSDLEQAGDLLSDLVLQGRAIGAERAHNDTARDFARRLLELSDASLAKQAAAMAKLTWRPRATVAFINHCACTNCANEWNVFAGFGVEMYRTFDNATRTIMSPVCDPAYPKEIRTMTSPQRFCVECIDQCGFDFHQETP